jgi:uncharacterized membrane protein
MLRAALSLPRLLAVLLLASLVLNVFFVSAIATHWFIRPAVQEVVDRPLARLIDRLPREDARVVREAHRSHRVQMAKAQSEFDAALAAAGRVVVREPFDPVAVNQALDEVRKKRQAITDARVQLYMQVIPRLSKQGRQLITRSD